MKRADSSQKALFLLIFSTFNDYMSQYYNLLHGPGQAKTCLQTYTKCAESDYPAHVQSIIQAFAFHLYIP